MTQAMDRLGNDAGRAGGPATRDGAPDGPITVLDSEETAHCDSDCRTSGRRIAALFDDDLDLPWLSGGI